MKTFAEFQEGVAALGLKSGSKLIPALMTGIGAAGTILQAKRGRPEGGEAKRYKRKNPNKKRTLSAAEKKIFDMQKKDTMQKGSDELKTKGLIKRGDKFTKQTTRGTSKNSDAGYTTTPEPTIEKPPTFTGRVDNSVNVYLFFSAIFLIFSSVSSNSFLVIPDNLPSSSTPL